MATQSERWDFTEGDRERAATSLVFKKGDKEFLIAYVICDARNEKARSEDIKRAKLIAAAPDLLDACQVLVTTPAIAEWLYKNDPQAMKQLRAAIVNATGKAVPA